MTRARQMARHLPRLLAVAAVLVLPALGPADAAPVNPHAPVSSDGSLLDANDHLTAAGSTSAASAAFRGTGALLDGLPDYGPGKDSLAEMQALLSLPLTTGKFGLESIIGADTRVRVTNTTVYPARAIVLITMNGGRCTGWMIGPNTVATAGHCVHSGGSGGSWSTNVKVYPGRNGTSSPYGSCTAKSLHSVTGWTSTKSELYDYGAIKLNCSIGNTVGWFGFWWQSASLTGKNVIVSGYPGDKPLTHWRSTGPITVTQTRQVFYQNDTVGGMSGSPVYNNWPAGSICVGNCSMAIHAYGLHGGSPHSTNNHATRIVEAVFNNLLAWKNAP